MGYYRRSQMFLNVAYCLVVFCVLDFRPLLLGGLFKLVASLVLAFLLAFVGVHSANICQLLAACLQRLPISRFPLLGDRRWLERWQDTPALPNEPSCCSRWQRPPPNFSL